MVTWFRQCEMWCASHSYSALNKENSISLPLTPFISHNLAYTSGNKWDWRSASTAASLQTPCENLGVGVVATNPGRLHITACTLNPRPFDHPLHQNGPAS